MKELSDNFITAGTGVSALCFDDIKRVEKGYVVEGSAEFIREIAFMSIGLIIKIIIYNTFLICDVKGTLFENRIRMIICRDGLPVNRDQDVSWH